MSLPVIFDYSPASGASCSPTGSGSGSAFSASSRSSSGPSLFSSGAGSKVRPANEISLVTLSPSLVTVKIHLALVSVTLITILLSSSKVITFEVPFFLQVIVEPSG